MFPAGVEDKYVIDWVDRHPDRRMPKQVIGMIDKMLLD
jgi:hypothetical protein